MSQGELQALALALFLSRATSPESPFRFVVLDDPVQAMDPAKIDGFVDVLASLSKDRRVIVLSHDDRLPAAVRRSKINASIYEVSRGTVSQVSIHESLHPAQRYIDDAQAVAADDQVPGDIKDRIIPGLCRMALETAAYEKYTGKAYTRGIDRLEVENTWQATSKLVPRLALALHGDATKSIDGWLNGSSRRKAAVIAANSKVHTASGGDHLQDVQAVRTAVRDLRAAA